MASDDGGLSVSIEKRVGGAGRAGAFRLDLAFEAPPCGVTALFGVSGSGKSLTLSTIAGAVRPDRGRIALGSRVLFDADAGIDVPMPRRAIGWVFQDARLFPHLSVEANLRFGLKRARGRDAGVRFDQVVEVLGVAALLARRPRDLSGGERQRVAIGRALLCQPALLLMDEPLSALDAPRRAEILPFLEQLKTAFRLPIVYVTHALGEVVRLADRLVVIEAGQVVAQGGLSEVLARADLPLLSGRADAATVIEARVAVHDAARGLTRLQAGALVLLVPPLDRPVGAQVRAVVLARDVLVARTPPQAISARNVLPGALQSLEARADGAVMARLTLDGGPALLAAITRDAISELGLKPGVPVWAVLKSVAVEGATPGGLLALLDA